MTDTTIRVRFAPSPTGHVHIGNIRAAIFNWLYARHTGGKFLLRVEDTDTERSTPEALAAVLDAMEWLELNFDEEPVYQSARTALYLDAADSLVKAGHAYREDKGNTGKGECVIFKMPGTDVTYKDIIKGELTKKAEDLKDFVIVRSDNTPVFHLANVVDDIHMNISHIIRGDDHVENTFKHIALFRALGATLPSFGHLPMIVNHQGKPYSKRDGAAFVGEFREQGYLPHALFNYLALLGWSPGDNREKMSKEEMIELFDLTKVKSAPAQLDIKKLTHLNAAYIAEMPIESFTKAVGKILEKESWFDTSLTDYFSAICAKMQIRTHLMKDCKEWSYFYSDNFAIAPSDYSKHIATQGYAPALADLAEKLKSCDFSETSIETSIREVEVKHGVREGKLNQPVRVAITGTTRGAGLYETAHLLGKERVLARLEKALISPPPINNENETK